LIFSSSFHHEKKKNFVSFVFFFFLNFFVLLFSRSFRFSHSRVRGVKEGNGVAISEAAEEKVSLPPSLVVIVNNDNMQREQK